MRTKAIAKILNMVTREAESIGVINDFHFESMHQPIVPMIMVMFPPSRPYFNNLSIKITGNNISSAYPTWKRHGRNIFPKLRLIIHSLMKISTNLYEAEQRQATLFTGFACIAIFIACLGLFGLSAFAITQRIKEIGIRKVLGAMSAHCRTLIKRFFETGRYCGNTCFPSCMVFYE
jgi:putative ABC transport system permease protein